MPTYDIDFARLKEEVSIETVAMMLKLPVKRENRQLRASCPICHSTDKRSFVITPEKGVFYCFKCRASGDAIALVCRVNGVRPREAAEWIVRGTRTSSAPEAGTSSTSSPQPPSERKRNQFDPLAYAQNLAVEHEALAGLELAPETLRTFMAGYAGSGVLRGRLALCVHDQRGAVIGFAGLALRGETPAIVVPNGFPDLKTILFNVHRISAGELRLLPSPLEVLRAFEGGIGNVVSFLTETVDAGQVEHLASILDQKKCELVP